MNINQIQALTQDEVKKMDHEVMTINGHQVYLVDLGEYFKYSALVFRDGHHIYYANDYELHHPNKSRDELKKWYLKTMENKLFTDEMLIAPLADYDEKRRRIEYLNNYYPLLCDDKVSAFNIFHNDAEREAFRKQTESMYYSLIGFFYTKNPEIVRRLAQLQAGITKASEEIEKSRDYWVSAFKYEMYNHEYAINWQGDWDVCGCFCNCEYGEYKTGADYLREAGYSEEIVGAYIDARTEVLKNSNY